MYEYYEEGIDSTKIMTKAYWNIISLITPKLSPTNFERLYITLLESTKHIEA